MCDVIKGASVIANDGKFLGKLNGELDKESIFNDLGPHGNPYASDGIWNQYGQYGSEYSSLSPFNRYSSTPPKLLKRGKVVGFLTVNKYIQTGVHPQAAKSCEF